MREAEGGKDREKRERENDSVGYVKWKEEKKESISGLEQQHAVLAHPEVLSVT